MKIDNALSVSANTVSEAKTQADAEKVSEFEEIFNKIKEEGNTEKLKETTQEFEALFLNMMFQAMRKTVDEGGLLEKSQARETFETMLDEELTKEMAKAGGIGLADKLFDQLKQAYENDKTTKGLDLMG